MRISDLIGRFLGDPAVPPVRAADAEADALVAAFLDGASKGSRWFYPQSTSEGKAILDLDPVRQVAVVHAALERGRQERQRVLRPYAGTIDEWHAISSLLKKVCRRQLPFTEADLDRISRCIDYRVTGPRWAYHVADWLPLSAFVRAAEHIIGKEGLTPTVRCALQRMRPNGGLLHQLYACDAKIQERIDMLLRGKKRPVLIPDEPWAQKALAELEALCEPASAAWGALLEHAESSESARPSGKWLTVAEELIRAVGSYQLASRIAQWAPLAREPKDSEMNPKNAAVLKGLVWCCQVVEEPALAAALAEVAEAAYRKIPGVGARSVKVGNACIQTLGVMPGQEAVAQLARLRLRIKYAQALAGIEKALDSAAKRAGMTPDELEELVVPTYGLEEDGLLRVPIGEYTAQARVEGARLSEITWFGPGGKEQASVPAVVKQQHAEELKALKRSAGEIETMLSAQRARIERLLLAERSWPLSAWRERYLDHPLLASLSRRLIWHFRREDQSALGIWHDDRIVDSGNGPIDWLTDDTEVRLWHPIGFAPEQVLRWRVWLEEHGVVQPFKQAHREIYILTDAELATRTYSNRFAGHILKQHQLNALCRERGWRYRLQGGFDSGEYGASLELPRWGLRAEFWTTGAVESEMSEMGIFLNVPTDQVRFYREGEAPLPLSEVPALVFSEVMRDVDLFVGVCSIGNDPNWQDRGEEGGYGAYWQSYSFGELSATAETRRHVLERLLPRLRIAAKCRLQGRFLEVAGELHTYKVHLGSGNILMSPNDQYLCIVPGGGKDAREQVFLPFEGDRTLSIILSKAFLLSEDTQIKDPTIVAQIRR